jgi:phosphate transport system substrate-binding protein
MKPGIGLMWLVARGAALLLGSAIPAHVSIMGATSVLPYLRAASAAFTEADFPYRLTLGGGGSIAGLVEVSRGRVDMAVSDIPPTADWTHGVPLCHEPLGRQPILFIAHPGLVTDLSRGQLKNLLRGRIDNWSAVGGPKMPVTVVSRPLASGSLRVVETQVLDGHRVTPKAIVMLSNGAVMAAVRESPGGLGFVESGRAPTGVTVLGIDHRRFDVSRPEGWPYYAVPTLYWRCPGNDSIRTVAHYLASQPFRREFGLY